MVFLVPSLYHFNTRVPPLITAVTQMYHRLGLNAGRLTPPSPLSVCYCRSLTLRADGVDIDPTPHGEDSVFSRHMTLPQQAPQLSAADPVGRCKATKSGTVLQNIRLCFNSLVWVTRVNTRGG